jgi:hypothetical protein
MQVEFTAIMDIPDSTTVEQLNELKHDIGEHIHLYLSGNLPSEPALPNIGHLQSYGIDKYNCVIPYNFRLIPDTTRIPTPPI